MLGAPELCHVYVTLVDDRGFIIDGAADALGTRPSHTPASASEIAEKAGDA